MWETSFVKVIQDFLPIGGVAICNAFETTNEPFSVDVTEKGLRLMLNFASHPAASL